MDQTVAATEVENQPEIAPPGDVVVKPNDGLMQPRAPAARQRTEIAENWFDRVEAFISRLSVRDNFWHRVCSLIWLPYAFFSGIKMKQVDLNTFSAVLPFRRFNRNWYRAMAGGALLANSEIAGGMHVFGIAGGDYTVVCRNLEYRFLRPCFGPAIYRMTPREDIRALVATGGEFDVTLDMDVLQQVHQPGERDKRVGKSPSTSRRKCCTRSARRGRKSKTGIQIQIEHKGTKTKKKIHPQIAQMTQMKELTR
jgi:hypothetical protein